MVFGRSFLFNIMVFVDLFLVAYKTLGALNRFLSYLLLVFKRFCFRLSFLSRPVLAVPLICGFHLFLFWA